MAFAPSIVLSRSHTGLRPSFSPRVPVEGYPTRARTRRATVAVATTEDAPLKLTYFDMRGGAEPIRLALVLGRVPFEDDRVSENMWADLKPNTPYGNLPVLTEGEHSGAHMLAILRYVGKRTGLYPEDAGTAFFVDDVMDTLTDMYQRLMKELTAGAKRSEMVQRQAVHEVIQWYWGRLDKRIEERYPNGDFVVGDSVSIADLVILNHALGFRSFLTQFMDDDLLPQFPRMGRIIDAVLAIPEIVEWHKKYPLPDIHND